MNLLLFSDIHCSGSAVARLIDLSRRADIVVGAGDFGTMRRGLRETLQPFRNLDRPIVMVPGNAESDSELREAADWAGAHVVHGDAVEVAGTTFFGLGGGVPVTPFGAWSFDISEDDAAQQLTDCPSGCVLVTHSPPHGVVDLSSGGKHIGSTAIRETVTRCQPRLVVCGHIHDCAGQWETLDESPVVNAGPHGILWNLETGQSVNDK